MDKINYITNLSVHEFSGGWSGMNHHIYNQLNLKYEINLIEEINPPYSLSLRVVSKSFRMMGLKGEFPAFAEQRLNVISSMVTPKLDNSATLNFFHGATSWLHIKTDAPYAMYMDACFASYINVYHDKKKFNRKQIKDIYSKEAKFLKYASAVFFSSIWAMDDAKKNYNLSGNNFHYAGLGGALPDDIRRNIESEPYFLFVGLDFLGKGGDKVIEAFKIVQREFPQFKLKIVGQKPAAKYLIGENIEYLGMINKNTISGEKKLTEIFANAYCFVLPTSKDMTPLVLVEAGSVGCPVISTNSFGIPEIVKHNETGILIHNDSSLTMQLIKAMSELCENKLIYEKMSFYAHRHTRNNFNWNRVGEIICDTLERKISNLRA